MNSRRQVILTGAGLVLGSRTARATVGARATAFSLRSVPGAKWRGTFNLADYLGKQPVVITFFATWCRPCEVEIPLLQKLQKEHEKSGLVTVGIAIDGPETTSGIGPMSRRLGVEFPIVHDADSRVGARYNPRNFAPFLVLIDRTGKITREREGWNPSHESELRVSVAKLVR
jgi:cytochrome c biogenesis protein CcmG, thiol:disulfide interchange protein DsbE